MHLGCGLKFRIWWCQMCFPRAVKSSAKMPVWFISPTWKHLFRCFRDTVTSHPMERKKWCSAWPVDSPCGQRRGWNSCFRVLRSSVFPAPSRSPCHEGHSRSSALPRYFPTYPAELCYCPRCNDLETWVHLDWPHILQVHLHASTSSSSEAPSHPANIDSFILIALSFNSSVQCLEWIGHFCCCRLQTPFLSLCVAFRSGSDPVESLFGTAAFSLCR